MKARHAAALRWSLALLVLAPVGGWYRAAEARPPYLAALEADPMIRPEISGCGTCHVAATGGGARNDFGTAFDTAGREVTPLLRAAHPDVFKFTSAALPDGTTFHFSDPQSRYAVLEREERRVLVDVSALMAPKTAAVPPAETRMSFFVTSEGVPEGGRLGGLAGADRLCQRLAEDAGAGDRTWRAYLSTSFNERPAMNAGDRIGAGPWYDARGRLVARGPVDLHVTAEVDLERLLTERGDPIGAGADAPPIFTGTLPDGTAAVGKNCANWTAADGRAAAAGGDGRWNAGTELSCAAEASVPAPRIYCFAFR
ncbi:MAG: hypothetical protein AB7O67_22680 [Vicinamibacterales bacterium]